MFEFFTSLGDYAFLRTALIAGILSSIACGVVGTYVVTRRISYIAGAIAHCVLGGMGAAQYLRVMTGSEAFDPIYGAIAAALLAALIIGLVSLLVSERSDTVIGAVWTIGMAVGVIFIAKTPGYSSDLMSYLFGSILMVSPGQLWVIAALDLVVLAFAIAFYNQFLAVCFDQEFAELRGVSVRFYYLLLLCLIALTVVLLVWVVGIVLVIALLTLPAAIAGYFTRRLWQMMIASVLLTLAFTTAGLAVSYAPGLPAGATIVVLSAAAYVAAVFVAWLIRKHRSSSASLP